MEQIIDSVDVFGNSQEPDFLIEPERDYYLNLREFKSGEFEAVLKVVRPMQMEQLKRNFESCGSVSASASVERARKIEDDPQSLEWEKAQNHKRAVRRAKQNIRWLCKVMEADRLFTLTYRENQTDREQARADFTKFLRLVRSGWRGQVGIPNWKYCAVLEIQDRGAFHIHCAVKGFQRIKFLRAAWYKALGGAGNETGDNTPGAVNVTNPDRKRWGHTGREWKTNKLSGYLTKYLAKTFDESSFEKKRYWHAKDLKVPAKQRIWIGGASMPEAIKNTYSMLRLACGVNVDCQMWVSTSNDCFWIAGVSS